ELLSGRLRVAVDERGQRDRGVRDRVEHQQGQLGGPEGQRPAGVAVSDSGVPEWLLRWCGRASVFGRSWGDGGESAVVYDGCADGVDRLFELVGVGDVDDDVFVAVRGVFVAVDRAGGCG